MPRKPREKSPSGIYHVIIRGCNKQVIFEEKRDYQFFLRLLNTSRSKFNIEIYAYCLMSNHVHLLINEGDHNISKPFRHICTAYAMKFNKKYQRVGHLFQDRFKSKPVTNMSYFFNALAYIHRNPIEISRTTDFKTYPWSSYNEYFLKEKICNTKFSKDVYNGSSKEYSQYMTNKHSKPIDDDDDPVMKFEFRLSDDEVKALIAQLSGLKHTFDLQKLEKSLRDHVIKKCKEKKISLRQLERLTGISLGVLRKI